MLIYIVLLGILILVGIIFDCNKSKTKKFIYIVLSCILLSLLAGLRNYSIGIDTQQYFSNYYVIGFLNNISEISSLRYEYGFSALCYVLNKISSNPQLLIFVTSIFINISVCTFIYKNSDNIVLSIILYILFNFFFSYMNIMRQAIAIAIVLFGFEFLKEKKYIKYIIVVLLASFFHASALLAILMIFLKFVKFDKTTIFTTILVMLIFFVIGRDLFIFLCNFSPRLYEYIGGNYDVSNYFGALFNFLIYIYFFIFGMLLLKNYNTDFYKNKEDINNIYIGIISIACIFSALIMKVSIFNRFLPYFSIFMVIWIPNCITKVKSSKLRLLCYLTTFSILFTYFFIIMLFRPEWYGVVPYEFYS